jgi:hypothetical protein
VDEVAAVFRERGSNVQQMHPALNSGLPKREEFELTNPHDEDQCAGRVSRCEGMHEAPAPRGPGTPVTWDHPPSLMPPSS